MTSRDPARLRQGLLPLTTTPGIYNNHLNTPISAVSMTSSHYHSAAQTPGSSIQPYNPQEWAPTQAAVAERAVQYAGEVQVSPMPPPPYSPPRSQQQQQRPMSTVFDSTPNGTPTPPPRMGTTMHRPSPEPANASFPPPPGTRNGSRDRRFLPSLGRRRDTDSSSTPPPPPQNHRQSMIVQTSFHQPSPEHGIAGAMMHGPPAARRAVSAGAVETPTSARSRSTSQSRWEPGMPLPPPPPGPPPPSSSRSQSVQSMDRNSVPIISPPVNRRRPPAGVTNLGPVPPTPADWNENESQAGPSDRRRSPSLTIDTSIPSSPPIEPAPGSSSSINGLNRQKAVRHDKTILQRRTESRTRQSIRSSIDERTRPDSMADIMVPNSTDLSRASIGKSTPLSGAVASQDSRNSTPRAPSSGKLPQEAETPPFSPNASKQVQYGSSSKAVAPKALPTPPPRSGSVASVSRARETSRPPSAGLVVSKHLVTTQTADQFAEGTIDRFREFAIKESRATIDADRVRLFADFVVSESRIRRERYSVAIGAMGSEIFDLTRDLFRPMVTQPRRDSGSSQDQYTPGFSESGQSRRGSAGSNIGESPQPTSKTANVPTSPSGNNPPNLNWSGNYMPSLSPILSMSVSENYENGSSRGRPPSRWWESDSQGEASHLGRSKRESKYMGVTKTQWVEEDRPPVLYEEQGSVSEYPPEKTGWHEQSEPSLTPQQFAFATTSNMGSSPCSTINRDHLDVSRLVTMPPPYPRHHPAVNNKHPELTSIRTAVRALSQLDELTKTKERFSVESSKRREQFSKAATERRQALRTHLQNEINAGSLSYADAGTIDADEKVNEIAKKKELEKNEYELFQNQVVLPLNELLTGRISRATELFDDLSRHLFDNGQIDADMPQEEGDDRPELLEKLTLLKWVFEAREGLHRAIYDLLSDRNGRYCEVVLTPYRLSGNTEKLKSAEAFFAEDSAKREYAFAHEVLERTRDFRGVVEKAVDHGVALQLSAFWDIAPPLCELLDNIPLDLEGFNIRIPASEIEENPSYIEHPMQYLFSLLLHAEKSTYQFIESHTNLLCLLHEVKEAVVHAKGKVLETQTQDENGNSIPKADSNARAQQMRQSEEHRLTEDLKEKVRLVQDQWKSALGENITLVKERLGEWLLQMGGWDESLEDGGVGGV
ncbi:hypothetical protein NW752_006181 [Fusarium irregulare]|uniref:Uncharacterized protein n=1 Tax=Fusarium irregulare TaxID=2494466 RepID=A0A9W8PNT2_9HYPO|nr:hypothetical protein NW766_006722 [Fusarium irregulare]KAJ4017100.1 hypothetical protein NW752_006181 [Fusarium irregulare]